MKTITDHQLLDHGVEHAQYFQGCGTAFTEFDDVSTGCGHTFKEALDDCLDMLAQMDWDTEPFCKVVEQEYSHVPEDQQHKTVCTWTDCE